MITIKPNLFTCSERTLYRFSRIKKNVKARILRLLFAGTLLKPLNLPFSKKL